MPNCLTSLRIIGALCLLTLHVSRQMVSPFWALYAFCGLTDVADGYAARRFKAETKTGALLDSYADIVFVVCSAFSLKSFLVFPPWLWIWGGIIVGIKIMNQVSVRVIHRKFIFPHTSTNKLTGLCLFICIPVFVCFGQFVPLLFVSALATFAAVLEGYYIQMDEAHAGTFPTNLQNGITRLK